MKKQIALFLALALLASLAGCRRRDPDPEPTTTPAGAEPSSAPGIQATPSPSPSAGPEPSMSPAAGAYTPGTYEGSGQGYGGPVKVTITVDGQGITQVDVTGEEETPSIGGVALEELAGQIREKGADIDGVAGATVTSNGVREAAKAALAAAGG